MNVETIAKICHEANKTYCETIGDNTQLNWDKAPEWARQSAIKGVRFHLENPGAKPSNSHVEWMKEKKATGWKYGPEKNPDRKEHPCYVPYDELPAEQKMKDYLFKAIVNGLGGFVK